MELKKNTRFKWHNFCTKFLENRSMGPKGGRWRRTKTSASFHKHTSLALKSEALQTSLNLAAAKCRLGSDCVKLLDSHYFSYVYNTVQVTHEHIQRA
jgi:hypothetical protein